MTADTTFPPRPANHKTPLLSSSQPPNPPNSHHAPSQTYTIDDAIEAIGLGPFQYLVLLLTGLCWTAESMEMLLLSFIKSPLQCQWNISDSQAAFISTAVAIGMLTGCVLWGFIADRFGRRFSFIVSTAFTSMFGILSSLSLNYPMMVFSRAMTGFGIGGVPVSFSMLIEFIPVGQRGTWAMTLAFFWAIGAIFEAVVAMTILPTMGWRWLVAISSVPLILVLFASLWLSESPRWLLARGRIHDAHTVLRRVASINNCSLPNGTLTAPDSTFETGPSADSSSNRFLDTSAQPMSSHGDVENASDSIPSDSSGLSSLLRPGARFLAFCIAVIWFANGLTYYGVVMLQPEFISLENAGHRCTYARNECARLISTTTCSNTEICSWTTGNTCLPTGLITMSSVLRAVESPTTSKACARQLTAADLSQTLVGSVGELPGVMLAYLMVNVIGRRPLMGYFGTVTAGCFLALLFCIGRGFETVIFFISRGMTLGMFQVIYLYTNEIYPAVIRARAMGLSSSVARTGMIITPFIAQYLSNLSETAAQVVYLIVILLAVVLVVQLPIETTQRKLVNSMEELVDTLGAPRGVKESHATFANDPMVPAVVRFFRWPAQLDGEARSLS